MARIALLLTLALVLSAFQCAASCAAVTVEAPCHHHQAPHHQDQAACSHELVLDRVHAPAIDHGFEACGALDTPLPRNPQPNGWGWSARLSDRLAALSHHRQDAGSCLSLRI
jgi:hypothetical protein